MRGPLLLWIHACLSMTVIGAYPEWAPCAVQHTMRPSVEEHGPPQQSMPPYRFTVFNTNGDPVDKYDNEIYTIRLSGTTHFRGFLIQARLATKQGSVIGHLKAGEFLEAPNWKNFGIKFQQCPSQKNSSITNLNSEKRYVIEANWRTNYSVGPVQFVVTVLREPREYWAFWMPKSGLLFPASDSKFKSRLFSSNFSAISPVAKAIPEQKAPIVAERFATILASSSHSEKSQFSTYKAPAIDLNKNWCVSNPCQHNGTCLNTYSLERFQCNCTPGWTGALCDKRNFCESHKCMYGICLNNDDGYTCDCDPGFGGQFCQTQCPMSLCSNGGICIIVDEKPKCKCLPGYIGKTCEIRIDRCLPNPCMNGARCRNEGSSYVCHCAPGYMGKKCHRPCQDVYGSCEHWGEQNKCESMRPATEFFDVNCAATCHQCHFVNQTVKTTSPLPPVLEPFQWILGTWRVVYGYNLSFPVNLAASSDGYTEELTVSNQRVLMFGVPYLNFTVNTVSKSNSLNQHVSLGFLTLKPASDPIEVAIMSTSNQGLITIEEGEMRGSDMTLETKYAVAISAQKHFPVKTKRRFKLSGIYLQETTEITRRDNRFDYFTKYFVKIRSFGI